MGDVGHFTAIVSAKSNKIGCGWVKDQKLEYKVSLRLFYKIFLKKMEPLKHLSLLIPIWFYLLILFGPRLHS